MTDFETRCQILAHIYGYRRNEANWFNFCQYNNVALPLAYLISARVVTDWSPEGTTAINETFTMLLQSFNLEDTGYTSLDDIVPEGL
jgi:hypothetical protein